MQQLSSIWLIKTPMAERSSLLLRQLPPFTLVVRQLHCPQESTWLQFQGCPLTQSAVLQRLVGDSHARKDLKHRWACKLHVFQSTISRFIPPDFVGMMFSPNNLWFTAFFLLFSLGHIPRRKESWHRGKHAAAWCPGIAPVPCWELWQMGRRESGFVWLCKAGAAAALLQGRFSSD